jgi:AhpD family alkylhydroperoxidase
MEARLEYTKASPEAFKAMVQMEDVVPRSGIDPKLLELGKIRASQLNGCASCIDIHTRDARLKQETEQRVYSLDAWRETPLYTEKERAALAWTEAIQTSRPDTRLKLCIRN